MSEHKNKIPFKTIIKTKNKCAREEKSQTQVIFVKDVQASVILVNKKS